METKSPLSAGRETPLREANRSRSWVRYSSTSSGVTVALSMVTVMPSRSGSSNLGPDVDLGGEGQLLAVVQAGDLHLGAAQRVQLRLLDRLAVQLGQRVVDGLLQHGSPADPLVDDPLRHPAGPEPGDAHLPGHLAVGLVDAGLQLVERHSHAQLDACRAQFLDVSLHVGVTTPCVPWMVPQRLPLGRGRERGNSGHHVRQPPRRSKSVSLPGQPTGTGSRSAMTAGPRKSRR